MYENDSLADAHDMEKSVQTLLFRTGHIPLMDNELEFCMRWMSLRRRGMVRFVLLCSAVVHPVLALVLAYIAHPNVVPTLIGVHALVAFATIGALLSRSRDLQEIIIKILIPVVMGFYIGLLWFVIRSGYEFKHILFASAGAMAFSVTGVSTWPGGLLTRLLLAAGSVLVMLVAVLPLDGGIIWLALESATVIFALVEQTLAERRAAEEARREFRFRRFVAPGHIVRHSLESGRELQESFKPKIKSCVCLSSDWRNYQALTSAMTPSQLSLTLDEYYALCERLLSRHLPEGNYFLDWIADELFVVFYPTADITEHQLIHAALAFSAELLAARIEFTRIHGVPAAVDIGLTVGESLIGLMGPDGFKKATALGEIPGRARRLQGTGKLLRHRLNEKDRIVFGVELMMKIREPFEVKHYQVGEGERIRDIPDRELFFIEAEEVTGDRVQPAA